MHGMGDDALERILTNGVKGFVAGVLAGALEEMQGQVGQPPAPRRVQRPRPQVEDASPVLRRPARAARSHQPVDDEWAERVRRNRERARQYTADRPGHYTDVPYEERHEWKEWAQDYEERGNLKRAWECWGNYYAALRNR